MLLCASLVVLETSECALPLERQCGGNEGLLKGVFPPRDRYGTDRTNVHRAELLTIKRSSDRTVFRVEAQRMSASRDCTALHCGRSRQCANSGHVSVTLQ